MGEDIATEDDEQGPLTIRTQLAFGAFACLVLSLLMGLLPDSLISPLYRTGTWLFFALLALACLYMAFPHMWGYSIWVATIYGMSAIGLLLIAGRGEKLVGSRLVAGFIGVLLQLAAIALVYSILMRIRIARAALGTRGPLGIWLLTVVLLYIFSNLAAGGWAVWAVSGSNAGLGLYIFSELTVCFFSVLVCWIPEEVVWAAGATPVEQLVDEVSPAALLKKISGKKEHAAPSHCPACAKHLKTVKMRCPSCGEESGLGWCMAHESFAAPCPSCGAPTLTAEKKCIKCREPSAGVVCHSCHRPSPVRNWKKA